MSATPPLATSAADTLARACAALEAVADPELPFLTIADMGILRHVRLAGDTVEVAITPTYSGCPAMDAIALDIATALAKAGFPSARIERVLSPAWTTDWLSPAAREKLRANGIAPPEPIMGALEASARCSQRPPLPAPSAARQRRSA